MIRLVLFDLDGVLIDTKDIHFNALNYALDKKFQITKEEHLNIFDGKSTLQKLMLLSKFKNLNLNSHDYISEKKQQKTFELISNIRPNNKLIELFKKILKHDIKIGVCTNSIRRTLIKALTSIKLIEYCSVVISNEDVKNPKPHPEMYWQAMMTLKVLPEETLIVEDSPTGLLAAARSGAKYVRVSNPSDVTHERLFNENFYLNNNFVQHQNDLIWKDEKLIVLIPMAGAGSRFKNAGFTFPKPLIQVHGKPMIQIVVENLKIEANYHYVVLKEHREKYNLDTMLNLITPNCKIIETENITHGAACTALLAKNYINNNKPLFFANSDQFVEWESTEFMYFMQETNSDGGIAVFNSTHPKWSFAKCLENSNIVEKVAEKNPISDKATVGFYYWKSGADFVNCAEKMIEEEKHINGEYYVCPVYNYAIERKKIIRAYEIKKMWGLGTPEDLSYFLSSKKI